MATNPKEYQIDMDFSNERLKSPIWAIPFFSDILHLFRWSGLSGILLEPDDVSMVRFVQVFPPIEKETFGFAILAVHKGDPVAPSLFAIPICLSVEADPQVPPQEPRTIGATFNFKNGARVDVQILINDRGFWKRLGRALLVQSLPQKDFLVDMLDPGFSSGIKALRAMPDDGSFDIKFLGGGDTTNIVIKFVILSSPGLNFVLKFYPRITFNTARYLNDMLASAKFHHFARLVAVCDYQMETVQVLFNNSKAGSFFNEIKQVSSSLNVPVNRFFPFIHLIQFLPGNGDGGMPFWNSAIDQLRIEGHHPNDEIVDIATKLGKTVADFHQALQGKAIQPSDNASAQLTKQQGKLEEQFILTRAHLAEYLPSLPPELSPLISGSLSLLDFDTIAKKTFPEDLEYQNIPRQYIHQDLHMGQLMFIDALKEFSILDLEGDPQLSWKERLACSPVERDLASLVRSLSYIKIAALRNQIEREFENIKEMVPQFNELFPLLFMTRLAFVDCLYSRIPVPVRNSIQNLVKVLNAWEESIRKIIITTYEEARPFNQRILIFYTLQRIMNEITYEIKFRPTNFFIPYVGLLELVEK